jgi:glycosyltransferase involved in cell wall biosynthesis
VKFALVTYRWGAGIVGGAEIHHRRLALELAEAGHDVAVITGDGGAISPFCHWGVRWSPAADEPDPDGIAVRRLAMTRLPTVAMAAATRLLQRRHEREFRTLPAWLRRAMLATIGAGGPAAALLNGWHHVELAGGVARRWSMGEAWMAWRTGGEAAKLFVSGELRRPATLTLDDGEGRAVAGGRFAPGWFLLEAPLPAGGAGFLRLRHSAPWRPLRDHRTLGVFLKEVVLQTADGTNHPADLWEDHRTLGMRLGEAWQNYLLEVAQARPAWANRLINLARGPRLAGLERAVAATGADHVIRANMPWATMAGVRPGELAMPLWHVEDDYYYWQPWIDALRRARLVVANSPYTAGEFFPRLGVRAAFVGPPIWTVATARPDPTKREAFRAQAGAAPGEMLVLVVCRKSPEKRYDAVAAAVAALRGRGVAVRMAGIGPDSDGRPFGAEGCRWLGRLDDPELQVAYGAADVLALMSESESFGMVIPEAWHHGVPVVVNGRCRPAASLVQDGVDGLLAEPGAGLEAALERLAADEPWRRGLGEAGRAKAGRLYRRGAAAERLLAALG